MPLIGKNFFYVLKIKFTLVYAKSQYGDKTTAKFKKKIKNHKIIYKITLFCTMSMGVHRKKREVVHNEENGRTT